MDSITSCTNCAGDVPPDPLGGAPLWCLPSADATAGRVSLTAPAGHIHPLGAGADQRPDPSRWTASALSRLPLVLVAVLSGVGALLRWPDGQRRLEYDEVIAILFARHDLADIVLATAADTMPPLYYWMLHLWHPSGDDLAMARLLSTVLGVAAIPVLYLLGRRLAARTEALLGAGLFALSPFTVFYGQYARMYALLTLLGLLATLFFVRWVQEQRRRDLALFTAFAALSLYVHNLAPLLVLSLDLLFLVSARRRRPALLELAAAHGVLLLAYLPWLVYLPGQVEKVTRAFWITTPGVTEVVRTPLLFLFHLPLPGPLVAPAAFVALLCVALTAVETRRRWRNEAGGREALLLLGGIAVLPVALLFLLSQVRPVYVERALMVPAAAYYILLAGALRRVAVPALAYTIAVLVALGMAAGHGYQYAYEAFPRSPHYALASRLGGEVGQGDLVLHDNKLSYFPTYFFAPDLPQTYLPDAPGSPNDTLAGGTIEVLGLPPSSLQDAVSGRRRVFFVVYRRALEEAETAGRVHMHKAWLDQRYRGELRAQVGDLLVYLYHVGTL